MSTKIDFVITWVDGNDKDWQDKKKEHEYNINEEMNTQSRYRDWEILKYWFRSVEKHASWVNRIFFITEGHVPSWLDESNEKLIIVKHEEFIPKEYLPTFNSNAIELNIHNIKELSECFVSFNDDMFINNDVTPSDFFKDGIPKDSGVFSPIIPLSNTIDNIILNNIEIINDNFNKNKILKKYLFKFFNIRYGKHLIKNFSTLPWNKILGFYDNHIPISYNKKIYTNVLENQNTLVLKTIKNKFRTREDINHWIVRYWQICSGYFIPRSTKFGAYYNLGVEQQSVLKDIREGSHKILCLNDNDLMDDFEKNKNSLIREFERKYGEKSSYEK